MRWQTTFVFRHTSHPWSRSRVLIWMLCFLRQFKSSVRKSDYLALRLGFLTKHKIPLSYNFHNYMVRSMEDEFQGILGISWPLWGYAIVCIFINIHGLNVYFWLSFIPAILVMLVGTKLEHVVSSLALEIMEQTGPPIGTQVKPRDDLFWFRKPEILLREKDAEICHLHGVPLLINDRIDIALACDADGVHVGRSDMPVCVARALLGPERIIGVSCKTPQQAHKAWIDGADYIGCGGVYPTNTKANNLTVGLDGLKTVCSSSKLPAVAIGGIGISNASDVMKIGVPTLKGVAVVSTLFDRECVLTETKKLHAVLTETSSS